MRQDLNNIDNLFKAGLGDYTEVPPPDVWAALEQRLDNDKKKRPFGWRWFLVLLLCLCIGGGSLLAWKVTQHGNGDVAAGDGSFASVQQPATPQHTGGNTSAQPDNKIAATTSQKTTRHKTHEIKTSHNNINSNSTELSSTPDVAGTAKNNSTPATTNNTDIIDNSAIAMANAEPQANNKNVNSSNKSAAIQYIVSNKKHNNITVAETTDEPAYANAGSSYDDADEDNVTFGKRPSVTIDEPQTRNYAGSPKVTMPNPTATAATTVNHSRARNVASTTHKTRNGSTSKHNIINAVPAATLTASKASAKSASKQAPASKTTVAIADNKTVSTSANNPATKPANNSGSAIASNNNSTVSKTTPTSSGNNASNTGVSGKETTTAVNVKNTIDKPVASSQPTSKTTQAGTGKNPNSTGATAKETTIVNNTTAVANADKATGKPAASTQPATSKRTHTKHQAPAKAGNTAVAATTPAKQKPAVSAATKHDHKQAIAATVKPTTNTPLVARHKAKTSSGTAAKNTVAVSQPADGHLSLSATPATKHKMATAVTSQPATKHNTKHANPAGTTAATEAVTENDGSNTATGKQTRTAGTKGKAHTTAAKTTAVVKENGNDANVTGQKKHTPAVAVNNGKKTNGKKSGQPAIAGKNKTSNKVAAITQPIPVPAATTSTTPAAVVPAESKPKITTPAPVAELPKPKADSSLASAPPATDSSAKHKFKAISYGIKGGFEGGASQAASNKIVISPYIERQLTSRLSIMAQPAFKYARARANALSGTQTFYSADPNGSVMAIDTTLIPVIQNNQFTGYLVRIDLAYKAKYDSIVKSYATGGGYFEVELPITIKYALTPKLSVYGGINLNYSKYVSIKEKSAVSQSIMAYDTTFTIYPTPAPSVSSVIHYPGNNISTYSGPLYPNQSGGMLRLGYMLGFSYELQRRWMIDALIQQSAARSNVQGGYNVNKALSAPYFRITLGYRLSK